MLTRSRLLAALAGLCVGSSSTAALADDDPEPPPPAVGIPGGVPGAPAPPLEPSAVGPTHTASPTMVAVGGSMIGLGVLGLTGGAIGWGVSSNKLEINWNARGPSVVSLAVGGGLIAAGLPVLLIGARRVPDNVARVLRKAPIVMASPRGVVITGTF